MMFEPPPPPLSARAAPTPPLLHSAPPLARPVLQSALGRKYPALQFTPQPPLLPGPPADHKAARPKSAPSRVAPVSDLALQEVYSADSRPAPVKAPRPKSARTRPSWQADVAGATPVRLLQHARAARPRAEAEDGLGPRLRLVVDTELWDGLWEDDPVRSLVMPRVAIADRKASEGTAATPPEEAQSSTGTNAARKYRARPKSAPAPAAARGPAEPAVEDSGSPGPTTAYWKPEPPPAPQPAPVSVYPAPAPSAPRSALHAEWEALAVSIRSYWGLGGRFTADGSRRVQPEFFDADPDPDPKVAQFQASVVEMRQRVQERINDLCLEIDSLVALDPIHQVRSWVWVPGSCPLVCSTNSLIGHMDDSMTPMQMGDDNNGIWSDTGHQSCHKRLAGPVSSAGAQPCAMHHSVIPAPVTPATR